MKYYGVVAVLVSGTGAWAAHTNKPVVTVCIIPDGNMKTVLLGQATASRIFERVGIQLKWRNTPRSCVELGNSIVVTISHDTSQDQHRRALAYATVVEGSHIAVHLDRVLNLVPSGEQPRLLGYVLAHEIAHIVQGVERHSASGIMKAYWNNPDYADMQGDFLSFAQEDISLLQRGVDRRNSRAAQP